MGHRIWKVDIRYLLHAAHPLSTGNAPEPGKRNALNFIGITTMQCTAPDSHPLPHVPPVSAVLDVDNLEGPFVLLPVHDSANAPIIGTTGSHALLPHLELLNLLDLSTS